MVSELLNMRLIFRSHSSWKPAFHLRIHTLEMTTSPYPKFFRLSLALHFQETSRVIFSQLEVLFLNHAYGHYISTDEGSSTSRNVFNETSKKLVCVKPFLQSNIVTQCNKLCNIARYLNSRVISEIRHLTQQQGLRTAE